MHKMAVRWVKRAVLVLGAVIVTLMAVRVYEIWGAPPLQLWHKTVPVELHVSQLDKADWEAYLVTEERVFGQVHREVTQRLPASDRIPANRYYEGSPLYPGHFRQDWNRSFVMEPDGEPVGAAVLLHGLTDSPYSMRNAARLYRDRGFVAVAIRMPGHGTVPAGLTDAKWEDWMAATRLAVREARRRVGAGKPLHLVGYSNGGALALKYSLDALENPQLSRPDRVVLISPMVGVTTAARFAGVAGWPAIFPAFVRSAWLDVLPEFNPFKYNSFPVNGGRQSYRLSDALQQQLTRENRNGRLKDLPPVLTFQSVIDATVSAPAVLSQLYAQLPANGSEIVLFDVNRMVHFGPLMRPSSENALARLLPKGPQHFRTTMIVNASPDSDAVVERSIEPGQTTAHDRDIGMPYPANVFSLSHVALPFPVDDPLYGMQPSDEDDFGVHLGELAPRGERGTLIVGLDTLLRVNSNPFYPYLMARIEQGIPGSVDPVPGDAQPVIAPASER